LVVLLVELSSWSSTRHRHLLRALRLIKDAWKVQLCFVASLSSWPCSELHRQRTRLGETHVTGWGSLTRGCTLQSVVPRSEINHIVIGDKTPPCMLTQSLYLTCIAQIDCKGPVDNRVERIYLIGVASCASMSSQVAFLDVFMDLQLIPPATAPPLSLYATNLIYFSIRT